MTDAGSLNLSFERGVSIERVTEGKGRSISMQSLPMTDAGNLIKGTSERIGAKAMSKGEGIVIARSLPMTDAGNLTVRSEKGIKYERVYSRERD